MYNCSGEILWEVEREKRVKSEDLVSEVKCGVASALCTLDHSKTYNILLCVKSIPKETATGLDSFHFCHHLSPSVTTTVNFN